MADRRNEEYRFDVATEQPPIRIEVPREPRQRPTIAERAPESVFGRAQQGLLQRRAARQQPQTPLEPRQEQPLESPYRPAPIPEAPDLGQAIKDNYPDFNEAISNLYRYEGLSVDMTDAARFGPTVLGVTQKSFDDYAKKRGVPSKSVSKLSDQERRSFYKTEYADKVGFDKLPREVALAIFDYGVHSGPVTAAKALQRAVGAKEDGIIGPKTLQAVYKTDPKVLAAKILDQRERHYKMLAKIKPAEYADSLKGWLNRINAQRADLKVGSYDKALEAALEVEKQHPGSYPKSPEAKMAFNPWKSQTMAGLNRINAQIARIPAWALSNWLLVPNLIAKATGGKQAEVPDWLVNNPIAQYYDRAAELYDKSDERFGSITEIDENGIRTTRPKNLTDIINEGNVSYEEVQELDRQGREWVAKYLPEMVDKLVQPWTLFTDAGQALLGDYLRGRIREAGAYLGWKVLENAPQQVMLLGFAGARLANLGLTFMGALSAAGKTGELSKREDIDPATKNINATFTGVAEAITEKMGLDYGFDAVRNMVIKQFGIDGARRVFYTAAHAVVAGSSSEFGEEYANSIATDIADYMTGVTKNLDGLWGRAFESGLIGAASGGTMSAGAGVISGAAELSQLKSQEAAQRAQNLREEGAAYKKAQDQTQGNIGTFDPANPDIRFKRPSGDEMATELGYEEVQELDRQGREWVAKYLPEMVDKLVQPWTLFTDAGQALLGDYLRGRIRVVSGEALPVYKHEGFHAFFDAFVSDADKIRMLDSIKREYAGSVREYMDEHGVSEDRAAEEVMAELMEHRDHGRFEYKGKTISEKLKTLLDQIIARMRAFFGQDMAVIQDMQDAFYERRRDRGYMGLDVKFKRPEYLGGLIKSRFGGIRPESITTAGYNIKEDFQQYGLLYTLSSKGKNLDEIATALANEGLLPGWKEGDSPMDALLEALKTGAKNLERQEIYEEWADEYEEYANAEYESLTDDEKREADEILRAKEAEYKSQAQSELAEKLADSFDENQDRIDDRMIIEDIDKKLKYANYTQEDIIKEYANIGVEIVFHDKMIKISGPRKVATSKVKRAIREATGQVKDEEARQLAEVISLQEEASKIGFKAGYKTAEEKIKSAKEILGRRRARVAGIRDMYGLTDADLRKISRKDIRLMSNYEFKKFIDDIDARAADFAVKRQLKNEIVFEIAEKELKKVENLIEAMELPSNIENMNTDELLTLSEALEPFQKGDEFLTVRQLQTVKNTELAGAKTVREAREVLAKKMGVPVESVNNIKVSELDKFRWDTILREQNPFYQLLVDDTHQSLLEAEQKFLEYEKEVDALVNKARNSRKLSVLDKLVPTDKIVFQWLEADEAGKKTLAKDMTDEEIALAGYLQSRFAQFRAYLVQQEVLKEYRENYITHIRRGFLEAWKADGMLTAFKEIFEQARQDEAMFTILDEDTQNILPLEKFFQFAMRRTGELKPSENVSRAFKQYSKAMLKKQALDKIVPSLEIYAHTLSPRQITPRGLEMNRRLIKFTREWINNKKGRKNSLGGAVRQGGVVDTTIRSINGFIGLLDLGLNIPIGLATNIGEQVVTYVNMGAKEYSKGMARMVTPKGRKIIADNRAFIGKSFWQEMSDTADSLGNQLPKIMFGFFHASTVNANKIFLLGSLTDKEWSEGKISTERLAQIKLDMGRWRALEGTKSIMGSTSLGSAYTKYKSWAIVIASRIIGNVDEMRKMIAKGDADKVIKSREFQEIFRATMISTLALVAMGAGVGGDDDESFIGEVIKKAKRELNTILGSLDPKIYFRVRMLGFLDDLAKAVTTINEGYKDKKRKGESKGVNALKKLLVPKVAKQFIPKAKPKPIKKQVAGYY